jgi:GDPmannose 4,6-dehydratase
MPRSLIVGAGGQDGRILWDQLLASGHTLIGLSRNSVRFHQTEQGKGVDILHPATVLKLMAEYRPDQVYYLAAHHHSSQDSVSDAAGIWRFSDETHVQAFRYVLEAARIASPDSRIFYASSSRVFGLAEHSPQTEDTPLRPVCMYGVTKAMGMMLADFYRRTHGLFVACGILFNHESPLRGDSFVSQRVVKGMARIRAGRNDKLRLGDLQTRVDWGYAPDYTAAMQLMLEAQTPQDFVIASGTTHSIQDLVVLAAEQFELSWKDFVVEDPHLLKRPPQELCGDASRLTQATGWRPRTSFRDLVRILAEAAADQEGLILKGNAQRP